MADRQPAQAARQWCVASAGRRRARGAMLARAYSGVFAPEGGAAAGGAPAGLALTVRRS